MRWDSCSIGRQCCIRPARNHDKSRTRCNEAMACRGQMPMTKSSPFVRSARTKRKRVSSSADQLMISFDALRQLVAEVVSERAPWLQVLGVTPTQEVDDADIFIAIRGCRVEPCILNLKFNRTLSLVELRTAMTNKLSEHFVEHPPLGQ